ncbi:hypothetical protein GA0115243_104745 [Streptomyces sp. ScaeMP-e83]|nr:hypothetical protein GA0115243_104745 [Streptomyces sp. ScaeMP-e83]
MLYAGVASASLLSDPSDISRPVIVSEIAVQPDDQGKGWGSEILKMICRDADQENVTLVLSVDPGPVGLPYSQLVDWYTRYGFQGNDEDRVMIRLPYSAAKNTDTSPP